MSCRRAAQPYPVEERHALDELHREEPLALGGVQLVQRHQVGVHDVGERPELLLEPVQVPARSLAQELERYLTPELMVERAVHHACAAGTKGSAHLEAPSSERWHRVADIHRDRDDSTAP